MIGAVVLVAVVPAFAVFGARFHARQKSGALGGRISRPKAFWLPFATYFWFVVCPVVALGDVAAPIRLALGVFGASMWIRGAAEMIMLYVTKSWRPPIGISHDVLCIALVLAVLGYNGGAVFDAARAGGLDAWALALCFVVVVSLIVEIHHAWSFFVAVRGHTTGDEGVWFADDEEERFRSINANTARWNWILGLAVGAFVVRYVCAMVAT